MAHHIQIKANCLIYTIIGIVLILFALAIIMPQLGTPHPASLIKSNSAHLREIYDDVQQYIKTTSQQPKSLYEIYKSRIDNNNLPYFLFERIIEETYDSSIYSEEGKEKIKEPDIFEQYADYSFTTNNNTWLIKEKVLNKIYKGYLAIDNTGQIYKLEPINPK